MNIIRDSELRFINIPVNGFTARTEAQFHIGVCYEKMGDIGKASEAFKNMIDRYPYSERLNDAVEHEFELEPLTALGAESTLRLRVGGVTVLSIPASGGQRNTGTKAGQL